MGLGMGRFSMLAAAIAVLIGFGLSLPGDRAEAMGLCSCCAASLTSSCSKVCAAISLTPGMCPAIVDYEGTGAALQGANPLNGMSFKEFTLGEPTPWQLELFRRVLESGRRKSVASYKSALHQLKRREIGQDDFEKSKSLYGEALVNYYHGIRAYLIRIGRKSD
jgi:hypothetical protein